jgi:hypothetical protein
MSWTARHERWQGRWLLQRMNLQLATMVTAPASDLVPPY